MTLVPNKQAPTKEPIEMKVPSSLPPALIAVTMSGAPLAKAMSVTPAMVCGILSFFERFLSKGVRNMSAVVWRI